MQIETKYHGVKKLQETEIITFAQGLPGFKNEKQFVLLSFPGNEVFYALQSVATPDLCFVAADPFSFFLDYDIEIDEATIEALSINSEKEVKLLCILTIRDPFSQTTANLKAPIVLNTKNQNGRQLILTGTSYQTRHLLFPAHNVKEG